MKTFTPHAFAAPPRCVLLDLDNTLYDYEACNAAGMSAARKLAGTLLKLDGAEFDRCFHQARLSVKEQLGHTASSHNRLLYFQRTLELAGFASQPQVSHQLDRQFWCAYLDALVPFEGSMEFLDDLRMANIPMAIVTDQTTNIQMRKMVFLDLPRFVDWLVTSEEIGVDKPDPRMFQAALRKLEIAEGPIWMIGDSLRCDMAGARDAVGAIGIQKVHGDIVPANGASEADAVFSHFGELRKLFAGTLQPPDSSEKATARA